MVVATGGTASIFIANFWGAVGLGGITGAVGAAANGGNVLKGAFFGAVSGAAFFGVGNLFDAGGALAGLGPTAKFFAQAGMHGMTGGVLSVLQGGKFGHGFVSSGLAKGFSLGARGAGLGRIGQFFAATLAGGTASEMTGGKFANGAQTAAIAFAVNELSTEVAEGVKDAVEQKTPQERIVEAALKIQGDSKARSQYTPGGTVVRENGKNIEPGDPKCNSFVEAVLMEAGLDPILYAPDAAGNQWPMDANTWARGNPSNWELVDSPQPGDIVINPNDSGPGHMGVVIDVFEGAGAYSISARWHDNPSIAGLRYDNSQWGEGRTQVYRRYTGN